MSNLVANYISLSPMPRCLIIAGPNGAGKTTFARSFLPREKRAAVYQCRSAGGRPPTLNRLRRGSPRGACSDPELDRLAAAGEDFAVREHRERLESLRLDSVAGSAQAIKSRLYTSSWLMSGWLWSASLPVCVPAGTTSPRPTCVPPLSSVAGPTLKVRL